MPDVLTLIYILYLARATMAVIVGVLILSFFNRYRKPHLRFWGWSWVAFGVSLIASAAAFYFSGSISPTNPARFVSTALAQTSGYLHLIFLLLGVLALTGLRFKVTRAVWIGMAASVVIGVVIAGSFLDSDLVAQRVYLRLVVFSLATAVVNLLCGFRTARLARKTRGLGLRLMSGSFLGFGVVTLLLFLLENWELFLSNTTHVRAYSYFLDFIYIAALGAGMLVSLLEDERQASHRALSEVEHLTYHDILTGLPNRYQFVDRMIVTTARREVDDDQFGVFLIDVDGFKRINDLLGHTVGDGLLREVAKRLKDVTGDRGMLARFGADEFAYVRQVDGVRDVAEQASAILESISIEPIVIAERKFHLTVSVGVSVWPDSGQTTESLLGAADMALYKAKERGRDRFLLHSSDLDDESRDRLAVESDLQSALSEGQFFLCYQPLCRLADGEVVGVEALIRWDHPELGVRPPSDFVHVAEQTNLIHEMGIFVLERACQEIGKLRTASGAPMDIAINLSPTQLGVGGVVERFLASMKLHEVEPTRISLEITEHELMRDVGGSLSSLMVLREAGVRIAVDDFGTGYSSLEYLKRLPVDSLKIDRAFVRDLPGDAGDSAIAKAVVTMASSLGLEVIAEGIETAIQHAFLLESGCFYGQGFYLGRPMRIAALIEFLSDTQNSESRPRV